MSIVLLRSPLPATVDVSSWTQQQTRGLPQGWEPAEHSKHKIGTESPSSQSLKQRGNPVEGPNIIYEVAVASTARVSGIDPLGSRCSKNG
jgi:hypothetical protein